MMGESEDGLTPMLQTYAKEWQQVLLGMSQAEEPGVRVAGRLLASGTFEEVDKWILAEVRRGTPVPEIFGAIVLGWVEWLELVCGILAAAGGGTKASSKMAALGQVMQFHVGESVAVLKLWEQKAQSAQSAQGEQR